MAARDIDWQFWLSLPHVKVWQAVALSMGMDPDRMNQSRDYWQHPPVDLDVPTARARQYFGERLRRLVAGRDDPRQFSPQPNSSDTPANHRVVLRDVCAWLQALQDAPIDADFVLAIGGAVMQPPPTPLPAEPIGPQAHSPARDLQLWQEEQVLRTTRSLGYDPLGLPHDDAALNLPVKSAVRTRCAKNHPVKMRAAIFDKAWDRMMSHSPARLRYDKR